MLEFLNPKQVMKRGFSIVTDSQGAVVKSSEVLKPLDTVKIDFLKGAALASIKKVSIKKQDADPSGQAP